MTIVLFTRKGKCVCACADIKIGLYINRAVRVRNQTFTAKLPEPSPRIRTVEESSANCTVEFPSSQSFLISLNDLSSAAIMGDFRGGLALAAAPPEEFGCLFVSGEFKPLENQVSFP